MTTTDSTKNFFVPIDQLKQNDVLDFLIHNQSTAVFKIKNIHYKTRFQKNRDSRLHVIHFTQIPYEEEPVTCSFEIGEDRYFFKSYLNSKYGEAWVKFPEKIFQLQRRNDFRVSIPFSENYQCQIIRVGSRVQKFKCELRDISLGGCQISFNPQLLTIKSGYNVEISLKIHQFESDIIRCEARHIQFLNDNHVANAGLKFNETSAEFLTELQGLLVHLDRIRRGKKYD